MLYPPYWGPFIDYSRHDYMVISLYSIIYIHRGDIPDDLLRMDVDQMKSSYVLITKRMGHYGIALEKQLNHDLFSVMLNTMPHPVPNTECLRAYCYLLCHPSMKQFPDCVRLLVPFIKVFLFIDDKEKEAISKYSVPYYSSRLQ